MITALFQNNKTLTAIIQKKVNTNTSGNVSVSYSTVKTIPAIFWRGTIAQKFISQRLLPDVSAVCLLNPAEIGIHDIPKDGKIQFYDEALSCDSNGAFLTGVTTINIENLNDSINSIKKNDRLTIGNNSYTILSTVKTGDVTTSLTFTPGLAANLANHDNISITPYCGEYSIIYADDIGNQGQVYVVPLKEFT